MKVEDYFGKESISNLKDRLMNRDAISINGNLYFFMLSESNIIVDKKIFSFETLGEWEYDDETFEFTLPNGDVVTFYDIEAYEP